MPRNRISNRSLFEVVRERSKLGEDGFYILLTSIALIVFGVIMVSSAGYYWSIRLNGRPYNFIVGEAVSVSIGVFLMALTRMIDYRYYKKMAIPFLIIGIGLLVATILFGYKVNGAKRWLKLGISLMPGELIKIPMIIFVAKFCSDFRRNINDIKNLAVVFIALGIVGVLIMLQPNMSTAMTIVMVVVSILFVANISRIWIICTVIIGSVGVFALIIAEPYRLKRIFGFIDPFANAKGEGFQVVQSLLAIGSGGLFGKGLGNSTQKTLYLPEPQNDFILSIIGEELGFLGIMILILLFVLLIWKTIKMLMSIEDYFGMLLGSGLVMLIGLQVLLNIGVITSSIPPTGVALPFISYGGNSMMVSCSAIGILLNISDDIRNLEIESEMRQSDWLKGNHSGLKVRKF